jgi:NAD(P)H-hydrate epimerase
LLGITTAEVQSDRPEALRRLAQTFGGIVVLKGQHTLVGDGHGDISVNSTGNSQLAQGGSGDLLAGYLAGLLAQPALQRDALQTTRWAVYEHGAAADRLSGRKVNWIIEELADELGAR